MTQGMMIIVFWSHTRVGLVRRSQTMSVFVYLARGSRLIHSAYSLIAAGWSTQMSTAKWHTAYSLTRLKISPLPDWLHVYRTAPPLGHYLLPCKQWFVPRTSCVVSTWTLKYSLNGIVSHNFHAFVFQHCVSRVLCSNNWAGHDPAHDHLSSNTSAILVDQLRPPTIRSLPESPGSSMLDI